MCHRFIGLTYEQVCAAVDDLNQWENTRIIGTPPDDPTPDWPLSNSRAEGPTELPGRTAWTIVPASAGAGLPSPFLPQQLAWGFTAEWKRGFIYNTRLESALANKGMWSGFLESGRCLAPAWAFFEPHATERVRSAVSGRLVKRSYRFAFDQPVPLYLGAVCAEGRFSVVTVPPNQTVAAVHNRMPLVLTHSEAVWWLTADIDRLQMQADRLLDRGAIALEAAPETSDPPLSSEGKGDQLSLF